jgi:hypothetical protein
MPNYTVKQGDCVSSIAKKFHIGDWSVIFDHPSNKALRDKRKSPNVLYPGDVLFIPEVEPKEHPVASGAPHRFTVRTPKKSLSIIVEDADDHVLADMAYKLVVAGETIEGKTDGKGKLETSVPVDAQQGQLTIGKFTWTLQIGHLNPIEHAPDDGSSGLMHRLRNLGYSVPEGAKAQDPAARTAIATFQARSSLPVTGELDDATKKKLVDYHQEGAKKAAQTPPPKPAAKPAPKPTAPRLATPPPGAPEEGYYDRAKHALGSFYDWVADSFQHDTQSGHEPVNGGVQKQAPVAPSVKSAPTTNVLSAPCTCFVCTLKLIVVHKSHEDLTAAHAKISEAPVPPAKPEDMLSWFHDEPFRINIVGIRRRHSFSNKLDDAIFTFFRVGADTGTDEWKPLADKYDLKSQDWVVGKSVFVPCKRFGGFWVASYDVSTDPGWEQAKDGTDISMAVLNAGDGSEEDKHTLRSGEAFVCPLWYKNTWRLGAHHKNGYGGHLALVQDKNALIERLNYPKEQAKPAAAPWLRVYKGGKDPVDYTNVVYHITSKKVPDVKGPHSTVELDEDDVIGKRYFATVGMNIHRAHKHPTMGGPSTGAQAGFGKGAGTAYSEGCQIFADSAQFDQFLRQCQFSKWWQCKGKPCKKVTSAAMFAGMGYNELVSKKDKPDYKQLACYEADHVSTCDDGVCGVRYDYVLIELTAKDLDSLRSDYGKLSKTYTFKNDNKLFVGGAQPAAGSGAATTPAPKVPVAPVPAVVNQVAAAVGATGSTCTCGSTVDPLYRAAKATKVTAQDMNAAVIREWKVLVGGKTDDLIEDVSIALVGQWALETTWGQKMMNFNYGNVKRGSAKILFTAFTTSEYYKTEKGAIAAADCPKHSRLIGHNTKGWGAAFDPPHKQTHFRAYETLDDGIKAHFAILQKQSNFVAAWKVLADHAAGSGLPAAEKERHDRLQQLGLAFGVALKAGGYATAGDYAQQMSNMATSAWKALKPGEQKAWKAAHPKKKVVIGA